MGRKEILVTIAYSEDKMILINAESIEKAVYTGQNNDMAIRKDHEELAKRYFENKELTEEYDCFKDYLEDKDIPYVYMPSECYVGPENKATEYEDYIIYSDNSFSEAKDYYDCFETCDIYEYWDGSNHKTLELECVHEELELEELERTEHERNYYTNYLYKVTDTDDKTVRYMTICSSRMQGSLDTVDNDDLTPEEIKEEYGVDIEV